MDAIAKATMLMVFWCEHSKASEHVRDEYETGIGLGEIVPILLDDTELPSPLREFHWIDLRSREDHSGLQGFAAGVYERSRSHYHRRTSTESTETGISRTSARGSANGRKPGIERKARDGERWRRRS
jgi:hypothetical protein